MSEFSKKQILILEDEIAAAEMLSDFLEMNNFKCVVANNGKEAIKIAESTAQHLDAAILDIMVPSPNGLEVCGWMREQKPLRDLPILFLTARIEEEDEIVGLNLGADSYLRKPASPALILAHLNRLIARTGADVQIEKVGELSVDRSRSEVRLRGILMDLTPTETQLMILFFFNPKRAFSRKEILDSVYREQKDIFDRTIDVHIKNLRIKLGSYSEVIKTFRGLGYGFNLDWARKINK